MASSATRARGKEHIPSYPKGFIVLRIFQLFFSFITLGLSAYAIYWIAFVGNCFMVFTSVITWIVCLWLVCAHSCAPRAYNYWAVLVFDILLFIFWLAAFALMAAEAVVVLGVGSAYDHDWIDDDDYYGGYDGVTVYGAVLAAAAGIGAIEFLLFFISLIIHSVVVCRHRRVGLHNKPTTSSGAPIHMVLKPINGKPNYAAVPQHGMPYSGQDTAYHPTGMYNPPHDPSGFQPAPQHLSPNGAAGGYYVGEEPNKVAPQHTGSTFVPSVHVTPTPPSQGVYEAAQQPPYQSYQA